jgi:hypothetical protein
MLVVVHCGQDLLEIERGVLESDWSSKVVEMPELPREDRFMAIPVRNPAFNNLYAYLCRQVFRLNAHRGFCRVDPSASRA